MEKFTVRSENRETHIITLNNGQKIWANNYLNMVLKDSTIIQIKFSLVSGRIIGFEAVRNAE